MKLIVKRKIRSLPDMNALSNNLSQAALKWGCRLAGGVSLILSLILALPIAAAAADIGTTFATPEEAVAALVTAAATSGSGSMRALFGPGIVDLQNPDRVQGTNEVKAFKAALDAKHQLVRESDTQYVLELGTNDWPFPIPLVKQPDGRWFFDTEAGKEELLNRRIGQNELSALQTVRAYVDAQREYASRDRNGDEVLEYAQRIASTPGNKDGLY